MAKNGPNGRQKPSTGEFVRLPLRGTRRLPGPQDLSCTRSEFLLPIATFGADALSLANIPGPWSINIHSWTPATMAIEAFLGTRPQKAFLFTIIIQALVVLTMVSIVYGKVGRFITCITSSVSAYWPQRSIQQALI